MRKNAFQNIGIENRIWAFSDLVRYSMSSQDYMYALYLVIKTKDLSGSNSDIDYLYNLMREIASKDNLRSPLVDAEQFREAYDILHAADNINLEECLGIISSRLRRTITRIGMIINPLMDEYENSILPETKEILLAEGEVFIPHLLRLITKYSDKKFTITTRNEQMYPILQYICRNCVNTKVVFADIYEKNFIDQKFDLILSLPAFGGRAVVERGDFICRELEMVALENLASYITQEGRLVIVMPARITFAGMRVADLRRFMQTTYKIEKISSLPEGVIPNTGIKTYMLEFASGTTENVIIRDLEVFGERRKTVPIDNLGVANETEASIDEFKQMDSWNINKIFAELEQAIEMDMFSVNTEYLGKVAEVFRGKAITTRSEKGNVGVINISNIGEYELNIDGLEYIEEDRRIQTYILKAGDILMPARGTSIRTVVFDEQKFPCIASANVIVIRPNNEVLDSVYLKIFLDSFSGKNLIESFQQGHGIMNVSHRDLNDMLVPVPQIDEQKQIAHKYIAAYKKYKATVEEAKREWEAVLKDVQTYR